MSVPDASTTAALVSRLRLADDYQVSQVLDELGPETHDGSELLRRLERKGLITPWQSSKLVKGDRDGYFLGGYKLLYKIAAGSFGRVFRGVDPNSGTIVAVKVLRRKFSDDAHMVELFHREGKVGQTLHHPNIVQILAVGQDPASRQHFIVMEFVEGGNLRDILKIRKKMSAKDAIKILEECAAGLAAAQSRGLTHRDLKPSNILLSSTGIAKLVDFGLAEIAGEGHGNETEVDRTVDYAGLERATGVKAGDVRSDIYFLGCVFGEMLTGRPPLVPTRDKNARMSRRRYEELAPLSPADVEAPASVFKLYARMTAFQPHDRYQTPAQLHEAIRRVQNELEGNATAALTPTGPKCIFVVEGNERLQDALREKLRSLEYRVLMAHDPVRAEQRYKTQPFHALLIDAGTAGEDGLTAFKHILRLADDNGLALAALLVLNEEQSEWAKEVPTHRGVGSLTRPVNLKQLYTKLDELWNEAISAGA